MDKLGKKNTITIKINNDEKTDINEAKSKETKNRELDKEGSLDKQFVCKIIWEMFRFSILSLESIMKKWAL